MASDHGELTRLTRGGHGMGGGFHSIKYVKADFFLLAKIEGRSLTGKAFVNARTSPPALTLEKTVTVPSHRLGGVRGGSATLKSLLHSGDSAMGRQPWEEIMPAAIGMALDLSNEQSRVESRLGTPRQGNRPLTPAQQRQGTPRGYTAPGLRTEQPQHQHGGRWGSARCARERQGLDGPEPNEQHRAAGLERQELECAEPPHGLHPRSDPTRSAR